MFNACLNLEMIFVEVFTCFFSRKHTFTAFSRPTWELAEIYMSLNLEKVPTYTAVQLYNGSPLNICKDVHLGVNTHTT